MTGEGWAAWSESEGEGATKLQRRISEGGEVGVAALEVGAAAAVVEKVLVG